MTVVEALAQLQATLGKGLYPTAIPKVKEILVRLREDDALSSQDSAPPEGK